MLWFLDDLRDLFGIARGEYIEIASVEEGKEEEEGGGKEGGLYSNAGVSHCL